MAPTRRLVALLGTLLLLAGTSGVPGATAQSSPAPSASPTPATSPTPAVSPSPVPSAVPVPIWPDADVPGDGGLTPGVLAWEAAGEPLRSSHKGLNHLTAWRGGFAALEFRDDERRSESTARAVWHSADGRTWIRSRLPAEARYAVALLPLDGGLVVATDIQTDFAHRGFDYAFFRSDDGTQWTRSSTLHYRVPAALERQNCQANDREFASIDGALMLYVGLCWDPCCGFGPSPASQAWAMLTSATALTAGPQEHGVVAWRSTDGAHWRPQPLDGVQPAKGQAYGGSFGFRPHAADGELLAVRDARTDDLIRSTDGIHWTTFGTLPDIVSSGTQILPVPVTADSVLVIGDDDSSGYGNPMNTWVMEADGTTTATMARRPAVTNAVIADGSAVMAFGYSWGPGPTGVDEDDQSWAWIMASPDGGRTWDPARSWTGSDGSCIGEAVRHGTTVVAQACVPSRPYGVARDSFAPFWVAELPAASPAP